MRSSRQRFDDFRRSRKNARPEPESGDPEIRDPSGANGTPASSKPARPSATDTPAAGSPGPGNWSRRKGYLRSYMRWLRPFTGNIVWVFIVALVTAVLSLVLPRATMFIIDDVLPHGRWQMLHQVGTGLLLIVLVQQGLESLRLWRVARLNARIVLRLRQRLFDHMLRLPLHLIDDMKSGGVTSRLSNDVDALGNLLSQAIIRPGVSIARIVLTIAMLFWINWRMALAAMVLIPPIVLLNMVYIRRVRPIYRSIRRDRAEIDARAVETFGGLRVVRAFRREATEALHFATAHNTVIRKRLQARLFEISVEVGWGVVVPICALLVVWLGGTLVLMGQGSIGGIVAFQMYLIMLLMPVSSLVQAYGETQQTLASMERVFDLLEQPVDKPDRPGAADAPVRIEKIEFDDVWFGYDTKRPVLKNISLFVPGGSTVALVGVSGAGKTTLTNLVARFYDPDRGSIRLNGIDVRDVRLQSYRRLLGWVQQDTFLFDGTIAENISYGRRGASVEEIEDAARRANASEFIERFPERYATVVGERGVRLSGGQAQRIAIARAILADPAIVIFDEATSNLDSESEQLIQDSIRALLSQRTTFIIAHRLSTVTHADRIVVLEHGRIVESGTHEELIASDTRYRDMVERQRRGMLPAPAGSDWEAPCPDSP